jgi:hypothetical protein
VPLRPEIFDRYLLRGSAADLNSVTEMIKAFALPPKVQVVMTPPVSSSGSGGVLLVLMTGFTDHGLCLGLGRHRTRVENRRPLDIGTVDDADASDIAVRSPSEASRE